MIFQRLKRTSIFPIPIALLIYLQIYLPFAVDTEQPLLLRWFYLHRILLMIYKCKRSHKVQEFR